MSALTTTFREVGAYNATQLLCHPQRQALVIVARAAGKAARATAAVEVAATTDATITATETHDHTEEMTMIT